MIGCLVSAPQPHPQLNSGSLLPLTSLPAATLRVTEIGLHQSCPLLRISRHNLWIFAPCSDKARSKCTVKQITGAYQAEARGAAMAEIVGAVGSIRALSPS